MATNIAGYISNLSKSVAYSAVDKVKKMSPVTGEFAETNADLFKNIYADIRDYKGSYTRGLDAIKKTKIYEAGDVGMKAIFEDISSGTFYNKKREDDLSSKILGMDDDDGMSFDSSSFDSSDVDFDSDDDFGGWDDASNGDKLVAGSIEASSRNNAEMVSMTVAQTGQQIINTQKSSTHLLYTQNLHAYNLFNNNMSAVNQNLSNIVNFSTSSIQTHLNNSKTYFDKTTELLVDQTALLRQIADALAPKQKENKQSKKRITFGDITGAEGAPDLMGYFNNIKNNVKNEMGMLGSLGSMMGDDSNSLLAFVSSPLKFIPDMIVNKLVPGIVEESVGKLDKSLSGFFGSLMAKFNTMANDEDNMINSTIGKIFGIKNSVKSSIDTGRYEKGKVDWDGKSRKALIEVIPTQLAKIISIMTGQSEKIFDYNTGKFVDGKDIKKGLEDTNKRYAKNATGDMRDKFTEYTDLLSFNSYEDKKKLTDDMDKFFNHMYQTGEMFDYNKKGAKDDYYKYGIDSKSLAVIRAMFKKSEKHLQQTINKDILEYRDKQNQEMIALEESGDSIKQHLYNGSNLNEFVPDPKNKKNVNLTPATGGALLKTLDNKGKNVFFYLQNIFKELSYIRRFGSSGSGISNDISGTVVNKNGELYDPRNMDNITITDTSKKSQTTLDREERQRKSERFMRQEVKRKKKNKSLVNVSEFDNDTTLENHIGAMIDLSKIEAKVKINKEKEPTLIDKLLNAENITDKTKTVVDKLNNLSKRPMDFFANTINKVDQRLYEAIYGTQDKNGNEVKGFIDGLMLNLKSTFSKFNSWLDEKILEPLKDKMNIESFKDLGKKVLGMFGIDGDEIGKSIKTYLFGDKENGKDGLFTSIINSTKDVFKQAWGTVKDSMKSTYGPVFDKVKTAFKTTKKPAASIDDIAENETVDEEGNIVKITTADMINNNLISKGSGKTQSYYDNFDFDGQVENMSITSKKRYLQVNSQTKIDPSIVERDNKLYESLLNRATTPGRNTPPSLLRQIAKVESRLNHYGELEKTQNRFRTQLGLLRSKEEVNELNIPFYQHKEKSSKELAEMFPGLVSDPSIGERINGENNSGMYSKLDSILNEGLSYLKSMKESLFKLANPQPKGPLRSKVSPAQLNPELINTEEGQATADFSNELGKVISNSVANWMYGRIPHFDKGSKGKIQAATVATVGEGEVVVNKNTVTQLEEILSKLVGGVSENKSSDLLAQMGATKLEGAKINKEDVTNSLANNNDLASIYSSLSPQQITKLENIIKVINSNKGKIVKPQDGTEKPSLIDEMAMEIKNASKEVRNALFGEPKADRKLMAETIDDITTNISKYAPEAFGSALLGGGISLITGALGGPLLGAAVGAGISLTKNSESVQKFLFGEKVDDERQGGILPKEFMQGVDKYLPDLKKFGIAGAATGFLPFLPFGPVGGLLLGSSLAYAKNNETVQKTLFGEEGLFNPESKEKLKKVLPRVGLGLAAGLVMGPFGIMGNAILGSGVGLLSTTQKFEDMILGVKSETDGKRYGGLFPMLKENMVDPIKNYLKGIGTRVSDFIEKDLLAPLKSAFDPFKKQLELMMSGMFDKIGNFMTNMFEKAVGTPIGKMVEEKFIKPMTKSFGMIFGKAKNAAKWLVSRPSALIGAAGEGLRKRQIRHGTATYMTAEERLKYREENNVLNFGFAGDRNGNLEADKRIAGMDTEELSKLREGLFNLNNTKSVLDSKRKSTLEDMSRDVHPYTNYNNSKKIMRLIRDGKSEEAYSLINSLKMDPELKKQMLTKLSSKMGAYDKIKADRDDDTSYRNEIFDKLKASGFDIEDDTTSRSNLYNLINSEIKLKEKAAAKKAAEKPEVSQVPVTTEVAIKNHNEIVDLFNEVIDIIRNGGKGEPKVAEKDAEGNSKIKSINGTGLSVKGVHEKQQGVETKEQFNTDGTSTEFVQNSSGEWVPNLSDKETKANVENARVDRENKKSFMDKLLAIKNGGGDGTGGGEDEPNKPSFLSKLMSGLGGILSKGLPVIIGLILAKLGFSKGEDGKSLFSTIFDKGSELIGNGDEVEVDENGVPIETAGDVTADKMKTSAVRQVLTNSKTGRVAGRVITSPLKMIPGANMVRKGVTKVTDFTSKGVANLMGKTVGNVGGKFSLNSLKDKITSKFTTTAAGEGAEAVLKSDGMIKTLIEGFEKFFKGLFNNSIVRGMIKPSNCDNIVKNVLPKLMKEIGEGAAKAGAKALAKVVGGLSTGLILNVAWAAVDFVSGFNKASDILSISDDKLTFGMKCIAGLIKACNGLFIVTAFIPEKTWVDLFCNLILPILDKDGNSDFARLREESEADVKKYNEKNGTNHQSVQEVNKANEKTPWYKSVWNGVKGVANRFGNSISSLNFKSLSSGSVPSQRPMGIGGGEGVGKTNKLGIGGGENVGKDTSISSLIKKTSKENMPSEFKKVNGKIVPYMMNANPKLGTEPIEAPTRIYDKSGMTMMNVTMRDKKAQKEKEKLGIGGPEQLTRDNIRYHDLRKPAGAIVSAADIDNWIEKTNNKGSMRGEGKSFISAAQQTGLDPRYIAAHAAQESGWGTSQISRDKNNMFGIAAYNSSPYSSAHSFASTQDGIIEGAKWIKRNYTDAGQYTVDSMIYGNPKHVYAQYDDGSPNEGWAKNISTIMHKSPQIGEGFIDRSPSTSSASANAWGDADTTGAGIEGEDSSKPSISSLFSDLGSMFTNSINRLFGFENEVEGGAEGSESNSGEAVNGSADRPADDWYGRTLKGAIVTSPYGNRTIFGKQEMHHGIDYSSGTVLGTPIQSPIDGVVSVKQSADQSGGFGNMVTIKDKNNHHHYFSHMQDMTNLKSAQKVSTGDIIGKVGNTGRSTGPHLHYEVRKDPANRQTSVEPNKYLAQMYPKNKPVPTTTSSKGSSIRSNTPTNVVPGTPHQMFNPDLVRTPNTSDTLLGKGGGENVGKGKNNRGKDKSESSDYNKLLGTIVEVLLKISTNTSCLSKIVTILTDNLNIDIPEDTKKNLEKDSVSTSKQIINIIKQSAKENSNPENEYLLGVLDQLATQ